MGKTSRNFYVIGLFALACLCLSVFFIGDSYAKYLSSVNETTKIKIARWRILVNNNDIREANTANAVITPVFLTNQNIANGIIAPTSEGYFDLIIDSTGADVSFKYALSVATASDSAIQDLVVTGYSINNGTIELPASDPIFEETVMYSSNVTTNTVRVYIKWDDSASATMDNADDTAAADGYAKLDVSLKFTQVAS